MIICLIIFWLINYYQTSQTIFLSISVIASVFALIWSFRNLVIHGFFNVSFISSNNIFWFEGVPALSEANDISFEEAKSIEGGLKNQIIGNNPSVLEEYKYNSKRGLELVFEHPVGWIESHFKGAPAPLDTVEYGYFIDFLDTNKLNTFQVEWCLYHEPTTLIGTIDYVSKRPDGTIDLYDWKRSSELSKGFGRCLLPELSHIPDSKYWKYTLQLNLYRFLAEENGYKVNKMFIVCFHPSNLGFQKLEVQVIDVKTILNKYRATSTCGL
jgi:hypothetical protein